MTIHIPAVTITLGDQDTFMTVAVGLVAALIAAQVIGHTAGFFLDLLMGIGGAFLGRWAVGYAQFPIGHGLLSQLITALFGALMVMAVARAFGGRLLPEKKG
jgi:uncharacterized membrane protein YeaQ/YmgE (transglycosylase-associated protein family)